MSDLQTLSTFALAKMLNDCAEGSALQRAVQNELHNRADQHKDNQTPWLLSEEDRQQIIRRGLRDR